MNVIIGTRGSKLALVQAEYVKNRLQKHYPQNSYELKIISTKGDREQKKALDQMGDKGIFVREIEQELLDGTISLAVHSMKDMPAGQPEGLVFAHAWKREDPRDVLILREAASLEELPQHAVIGTGSRRRAFQLLQLRKDLRITGIRGNVDTRIKKMQEEQLDGIVLAAAGLHRLGRTSLITQYFEPLGLKLCEVTPQVLDEFQEKILLEGYTTNTVIHYHAIFGKAFKDAVRKDYLETNPMLKVDRPKKNSFRPNFYSKDEVQQLLEVSQDDPLHLCILITAYYGLRRSEVLGLKWSSIDFERKSITINHKVTEQLVNGKYVPVVSDVMKNKTSCRTLPLIPAVEEELLKQKEKQQLYRKLFKKSYSTEYLDFVCTDQEGKLIRPNFVTEHFDWLLTKYGLKHIRFHDLRHSCASLMVMNGVSMKQVQEWLGHSTFSTTADIYAHLDYKSKQGSAGVIANLLGEFKLPK